MYDRSIDALLALRAAAHADADIAELWQLACAQRREDVTTVTGLLHADRRSGAVRRPDDSTVDLVYTYTSPETFELLVRQCGWTAKQYQYWLGATLQTLLLDTSASHRS